MSSRSTAGSDARTVYQMERGDIVGSFSRGEEIPELPALLGTAEFCRPKPGRLRVAWNKFKGLFYRVGICRPSVWRLGRAENSPTGESR